jgi:hypothetical protein
MAKIQYSRNIVLSLKDYLEPLLTTEGYSFTFVSDWGSDNEIVLPQDYTGGNQIKLPAGKFTVNTRSKGGHREIGSDTFESLFFIGFFIHAETEAQAYDLMDFIHDRLESGENVTAGADNIINIYNYGTVGYPSDSAPLLGEMYIQEVKHRYISDLGSSEVAMKHAGDITMVGMMYVA